MTPNNLRGVAEQVVARACLQGFVEPCEVREELIWACIAESHWKEVLALAGPSLRYRLGRYYYAPPSSDPTEPQPVFPAASALLEPDKIGACPVDRRGKARVDFFHPVQVVTEDGAELTMLSRDLSACGIRMVGKHRLLGQKVLVRITFPQGGPPYESLARVLWSCPAGDDLIENGASFSL